MWPLSRSGFPKKFLCLSGTPSPFQQAAQLLAGLGDRSIEVQSQVIVTGEDHRFVVAEQLREIGVSLGTVLLEPMGRNTAPALASAALAAMNNGDGADLVLVVTPSDRIVMDSAAFNTAIQTAAREAEQGTVVILGVSPNRPETSYGYISVGASGKSIGPQAKALHVEGFVEKPNADSARRYFEDGYFWNSGIFVLKASVWLKAL